MRVSCWYCDEYIPIMTCVPWQNQLLVAVEERKVDTRTLHLEVEEAVEEAEEEDVVVAVVDPEVGAPVEEEVTDRLQLAVLVEEAMTRTMNILPLLQVVLVDDPPRRTDHNELPYTEDWILPLLPPPRHQST